MVPATGVEPAHAFAYQYLKLARLPKSATPASSFDLHAGAVGGTRTHTPFREQPPQGCAATRFRHDRIPSIRRSRHGAGGGTRTLKASRPHRPERCAVTRFRHARIRTRSAFHGPTVMVPVEGLEPPRRHRQAILNRPRLPFRHTGIITAGPYSNMLLRSIHHGAGGRVRTRTPVAGDFKSPASTSSATPAS